jgi:large subunit ribosomal protein L3
MYPAILGRKVGMTQVFAASGERTSATLVEAGPCVVLQVKRADGDDGYNAVQLGFRDVKPHRATLPAIGHARKAQATPKAYVKEIRLAEPPEKNIGETITVESFTAAQVKWVDVIGTTKGRGTQGAMKRWGFGGMPASHGTERKHRSPGSISSRGQNRGTSGAIKKGKRMGGHMGDVRRTAPCLALLGVDLEHNLLVIQGSIPGPTGGYVLVRKSKTRA